MKELTKIKSKPELSDLQVVFILGFITALFSLPLRSNYVTGTYLLFTDLILLLGTPLLFIAFLFFAKVVFKKNRDFMQFIKFLMVGVSNTAVSWGTAIYFAEATGISRGLPLAVIASVAFLAGCINSYIWNSHWTFRENFANDLKEFEKFFLVSFIGLVTYNIVLIMVSFLAGYVGHSLLLANLGILLGMVIAFAWNFFGYKLLVFRK